ncbi:MAG: nucleoside recognition domain-containing protein [Alphaproteobacteria bacterium]|nr:nucleoside recognition domain-containing protein [Alphaproteobacteria bacterium]
MALNIIWLLFFIVAFLVAIIKLVFFGDTEIFKTLSEGIFESAKSSVLDVGLPLAGTMIFFLGIMNIAEQSGMVLKLSKHLKPFLKKLFPEVPENHPAFGHMVLNFSANLLGLDNAATPFGLKAMESLQDINPIKQQASNAQIMFLVLHTSGLTLIPLTIISYRIAAGSQDAAVIFIPCILATLVTTFISIIIVSIYQKIRWNIKFYLTILAIFIGMGLLLYLISVCNNHQRELISKVGGNFLLWLIIIYILGFGFYKKVSLFDSFIEGAKHGLDLIFKIIPYLVAMLVGIRVFRDSGALQTIIDGIIYVINLCGIDSQFVQALPVAIMKPFSGSGARGLMLDVFKTYSPDSFSGKLASIFQGSADTTLYIIALYFGSVGIKNIRYALWAGLLTDFLGVIGAIFIGYLFFG